VSIVSSGDPNPSSTNGFVYATSISLHYYNFRRPPRLKWKLHTYTHSLKIEANFMCTGKESLFLFRLM
jgi:hypothetical protein